MRKMVAIREGDTEDIALQIEAYSRKSLSLFPPDVIVTVVERWPDDNEFWPTWFKLREALDARLRYVKAASAPRLEHTPPPPDTRGPPTRREIEAELAKLRDPNRDYIARAALIKLGETMLSKAPA